MLEEKNSKLAYIWETKRILRFFLDDYCDYVNQCSANSSLFANNSQIGHKPIR